LAYRVIVQRAAVGDAQEYAAFIRDKSGARAADLWLMELQETVDSLSEMPARFPVIDEADEFEIELRRALLHSHRIIFI